MLCMMLRDHNDATFTGAAFAHAVLCCQTNKTSSHRCELRGIACGMVPAVSK